MIGRILRIFEPMILMLVATVILASVLPARGAFVPIVDWAADIGIVILFFLHGAKLSREAIWDGARNWKLHLAVLATTFGLFPLLGLGITAAPVSQMLGLGPLAAGFLFLTLLPSTVQSSIAFTAIARGNVAAAVCSASFSNFAGIFLTPLLVSLLMPQTTGQGSGISWSAMQTIIMQLLLPFFAGHMLRPWIGAFVTHHKQMLTIVDRGSILLVVYTAFGAAVVEGLWQRLSVHDLVVIAGLCAALLAVVLGATQILERMLGLKREDGIVLTFCGSKKSLASGVPMAGVLFPAAQVGVLILPLMLFHQLQLIVCAIIARRYAARAEPDPVVTSDAATA